MMTVYSNEEKGTRILRVLAVILAIVFLASAALFFLSLWERHHGDFEDLGTGALKGTLQYNGKEYVLKENLETYLFLGLDKFEGESTESYNNDKQADFLMLIVVDNENSSYTALHINRDTVTEIDVLGVAGDKIDIVESQIALAHTYGNGKEVSCRNTAKAVSKMLLAERKRMTTSNSSRQSTSEKHLRKKDPLSACLIFLPFWCSAACSQTAPDTAE